MFTVKYSPKDAADSLNTLNNGINIHKSNIECTGVWVCGLKELAAIIPCSPLQFKEFKVYIAQRGFDLRFDPEMFSLLITLTHYKKTFNMEISVSVSVSSVQVNHCCFPSSGSILKTSVTPFPPHRRIIYSTFPRLTWDTQDPF